jgi:hypothetical protein
MDEITRRRFIPDRAATTAGPLRFALQRHDGGSAAAGDTRRNHHPAVRVAACDPPAMPSTRRIVQRGRPVDHYEIAVRQLAAGTQQHDPGVVATGGYVITPRSRPTVLWSDRTQIGPGGTVRAPLPRGAHRPPHRAVAIAPCSCSTARGWGRGGTMKEAARGQCFASRAHGRRTRGARLVALPRRAPHPRGSRPVRILPRNPAGATAYKGCRARRGRG